jgi:hypothetical protein
MCSPLRSRFGGATHRDDEEKTGGVNPNRSLSRTAIRRWDDENLSIPYFLSHQPLIDFFLEDFAGLGAVAGTNEACILHEI